MSSARAVALQQLLRQVTTVPHRDNCVPCAIAIVLRLVVQQQVLRLPAPAWQHGPVASQCATATHSCTMGGLRLAPCLLTYRGICLYQAKLPSGAWVGLALCLIDWALLQSLQPASAALRSTVYVTRT
jgi:hypothetical protein